MIDFTREVPVSLVELSELLGVSQNTLRNWIARGLEASKLGGRIYTSLEALQRFAVPMNPPENEIPRRSRRKQEEGLSAREMAKIRFGI